MGHPDEDDVRVLKRELRGLFDHIQRIRQEIAAIRRPGDTEDRFISMSDQLDAIVENTESATNTIMENVEQVDEIIMSVRPQVQDKAACDRLDEIPDLIGGIFEACSFQDITGQRITKVVKTLQYIERRVNSLISIWGEQGISAAEIPDDIVPKPTGDQNLLHGPQLQGQGVSQNEVDALLNKQGQGGAPAPGQPASQDDIDALFDSPAPKPPAEEKKAPEKKAEEQKPAAKPEPAKPAKESKAPPPPSKAADKGKKDDDNDDDGGKGMGQDDIDKLFG